MKRFALALLFGLITQALVWLFWQLTPHTSLPPILDWVIAPGFIPIAYLFPVEGCLPPGAVDPIHRMAITLGFILNIMFYAAAVYAVLSWRAGRKSSSPERRQNGLNSFGSRLS